MNPGQPKFEVNPASPENTAEAGESGKILEQPKAPESSKESVPAAAPTTQAHVAQPVVKDEATLLVEKILEEDIASVYKQMPPKAQAKFKIEGERLTKELSEMIRTLKITAERVLSLITAWLKLIPGVNKFFLIQEAKIKTDKVLLAAEVEKKRQSTVI